MENEPFLDFAFVSGRLYCIIVLLEEKSDIITIVSMKLFVITVCKITDLTVG